MRFTALLPPPPTPMTLILAPASCGRVERQPEFLCLAPFGFFHVASC
jgi:hypothetical protein